MPRVDRAPRYRHNGRRPAGLPRDQTGPICDACAFVLRCRPAGRARRPAAAAPPHLPARPHALQRQRRLYRPLARALRRVCRGRGPALSSPAGARRRRGRGRRQYRRLHRAAGQAGGACWPGPRLRAAACPARHAARQPGPERPRQRHPVPGRRRCRARRDGPAVPGLCAAGQFRRCRAGEHGRGRAGADPRRRRPRPRPLPPAQDRRPGHGAGGARRCPCHHRPLPPGHPRRERPPGAVGRADRLAAGAGLPPVVAPAAAVQPGQFPRPQGQCLRQHAERQPAGADGPARRRRGARPAPGHLAGRLVAQAGRRPQPRPAGRRDRRPRPPSTPRSRPIARGGWTRR